MALGVGLSNEELAVQAQNGNKIAKERLVKQNIGLVHMVARRYPMKGVQYEDQIQEGCIGLIECLNTYSPEKGTFATHAVHRIKANILRKGNEQAQTIQIPTHVFETRLEINKFIKDFIADHKKRPTTKQIALGIDKPIDNIRNLMITDSIGQPGSIDAAINVGDDEISVSETYGGEWLEDNIINEQKYEKMLQFVSELPNPERTIIECLYGLNNKPVHSMSMLEGKIRNNAGSILSLATITARHTLALTFLEDRGMGLNIPYESPRDRKTYEAPVLKDPSKRDIVVVISKEEKKAHISFDLAYTNESIGNIRVLLKQSPFGYLLESNDTVVLQYTTNVDIQNLEAEITKCYNDVASNGFDIIL